MPTLAEQTAADNAEVDAIRQQFGNDKAAELALELAKRRRTPSASSFAGLPKWLLVLIAIWVGALETADKLPQLLLTYPRYEAALAETQAKILQPDLIKAQIVKAENEAKASNLQPAMIQAQLERAVSDAVTAKFSAEAAPNQPRLVAAQADKMVLDAEAAKLQPALMVAQLEKAQNDAKASVLTPQRAALEIAKTTLDIQAAVYQPKINEVQLAKLGIDAKKAIYEQTLTAANAMKAAQENAMTNAALNMVAPIFSNLLKQFGVNVPLDQIAPQLNIIDPNARTRDLQDAMPNAQARPNASPNTRQAAARPTQSPKPQTSTDFFAEGVRDRKAWAAQINEKTTQGDAARWIGTDRTRRCYYAGGESQEWKNACEEAYKFLNDVDNFAVENADYKRGWLSIH